MHSSKPASNGHPTSRDHRTHSSRKRRHSETETLTEDTKGHERKDSKAHGASPADSDSKAAKKRREMERELEGMCVAKSKVERLKALTILVVCSDKIEFLEQMFASEVQKLRVQLHHLQQLK